MEPFLMSLVSESDLWMYVSSLGSLSAGRIDPDHSLFPYCVEDQIHRTAGKTGPSTIVRVWQKGGTFEIWEPFCGTTAPEGCERQLSKSVLGNRITFEERNLRLSLTLRYTWAPSERFGFVRTTEVFNEGPDAVSLDIIDGLLNMLPPGVTSTFIQRMSVLADAYTECEVDPITGVAIISLASLIVDKPEPGEALHASVVWSRGFEEADVLLSLSQIAAFRQGRALRNESMMKGQRANYLLSGSLSLAPGADRSWDIVSDVGLSQSQVEELRAFLTSDRQPRESLRANLAQSAENLAKYVAAADGQSCSADTSADRHHEACVLFNIMRGGIFADGDNVNASDFREFVKGRNHAQATKHSLWLGALPCSLKYRQLQEQASQVNDPNLTRLVLEYLPLTFSRRHGDPSRPWNRFAIRLKNEDGTPLLAYEGNWRDIFQNWEALSLSYPMFIQSIIAKFVNASTIDGFNPYRITREGIDWEVPDPDDEWSAMGYWGDHQIIYLLKFLEQARQIDPCGLNDRLGEACYSYANVPLRLRPYEAMVHTPHSTIDFDYDLHKSITGRIPTEGEDARLVPTASGDVYHATLAEKLLVPALSKLSNLVADAGIWMNTQRPEWNDANNALVGNGVSMVTLCYLRRYLVFCRELFANAPGPFSISTEVADWLEGIAGTFEAHRSIVSNARISDQDRRTLLDQLESQFADYRRKVYEKGFSGQRKVQPSQVVRLCEEALPYLEHSIHASKRSDGLYHAYNLVDLREPGKAKVGHLYEMLEGQVAVLSAGMLGANEALALVNALFKSKIYREDQETFMLYPERKLPGFLEKNVIPSACLDRATLLGELIEVGDNRVITKDAAGVYRFAPNLRNASVLSETLDAIEKDPRWSSRIREQRQSILDAYESVFGHRFFTGRSGSMYGYEGLGSVYWHMVSKLLVAIEESFHQAAHVGAAKHDLAKLAKVYYRVRSGMGFNKTPHQFGAFPSDPYSHTPANRGAKQPGMTGQSKEDILARWMECGVFSVYGCIEFQPSMLKPEAFLSAPQPWALYNVLGAIEYLDLPTGTLAFTICGVPVIYHLGAGAPRVSVFGQGGFCTETTGLKLSEGISRKLYGRTGEIQRIDVHLSANEILTH
ncbi:MAG: hypothetical protein P4L46_08195 [Fimbriimonas sp.]|nr:hypothetical protein [Fimbriimonas sp.]